MSRTRLGPELLVALVLGAVAAGGAQWGTAAVGERIVASDSYDRWFQSDPPRVFENLTNRDTMQSRSRVHPLFALLGYPPVFLLRRLAGSDWGGVRIFMSLQNLMWGTLLHALLRMAGLRRLDAILFTLLGMTSASFMFWSTVPETYTLGSLTIMLALILAILAERRALGDLAFLGVTAAGFAVTLTNSMAGILATLVHRTWRRAARIAAAAVLVVLALGLVQKAIFPRTVLFVSSANLKEVGYLFAPTPERLLATGAGFLAHPMVMPAPLRVQAERGSKQVLSTQGAAPGSASALGAAAVVIWTAMLALGLSAAVRMEEMRPLRLVLGGTLLGQLALHAIHGEEAFLYSLHWLPGLVVLAALATRTRARRAVLSLAGLLIVCAAINNVTQFRAAIQRLAQLGS